MYVLCGCVLLNLCVCVHCEHVCVCRVSLCVHASVHSICECVYLSFDVRVSVCIYMCLCAVIVLSQYLRRRVGLCVPACLGQHGLVASYDVCFCGECLWKHQ